MNSPPWVPVALLPVGSAGCAKTRVRCLANLLCKTCTFQHPHAPRTPAIGHQAAGTGNPRTWGPTR
eukprot:11186601-Lingulodinium_polyedra.AAC.1